MDWRAVLWKVAQSEYTKLVPILALAFYIGFIPHAGYPYPVHLDEWEHLAQAKAIMKAGAIVSFSDAGAGLFKPNLEAGFQMFLGVFQQVSGISWLTIVRYLPGAVYMITALCAYVLGRRFGFGWEAAFFASLIPTTVGILGPAFMVPLAMGLLFIPLALFVVFSFKTIWSYLVLFLFTSYLLVIHATTAVALVIVLFPYALLNIKKDFKHSLGIGLALLVPFLAPFPWIFGMLLPTAKSLFSPVPLPSYVAIPYVIRTFGYIPVALALLGSLTLALRGRRETYGLVLGLLAMLVMLLTFYTFHYGLSIMYERGLMYMMLLLAMIAGAGLMSIRKLSVPPGLTGVPFLKYAGSALCLGLVILTLVTVIPARQKTPYYHMIDQQDYAAFVWIRDNIGEGYQKALLDPWKATAFVAITGKAVFTRITEAPKPKDTQAAEFLKNGSADTDFLRQNDISIVYTRQECLNPDLVRVSEGVYLLKK